MISDVDDYGSGAIEYEEFWRMMAHHILNSNPKEEIRKACRLSTNTRLAGSLSRI